jgi:disulfide bond formation protein DsbB
VKAFLASPRGKFALVVAITTSAMLFALYLQYVEGLAVCPLCLTQRVFIVGAGAVSFLAALHNPHGLGQRIYAALATLLTLIGFAFGARHVWLQHLPPEQVPACGPDLEYMLETLPFGETFKILIMGDGNCAETVWTFLGFSIPELGLGMFTSMAILLISILFQRR